MHRAHCEPVAPRAGSTESAAQGPRRQIGLLARPEACERARIFRRYAGLALLPFGRLRLAVIEAEQVAAPLLEAGGALCDVGLVVQSFARPDIHDRDREGRIAGGLDRNPTAAEQLRGGIAVRVDVDEIDAELLGPQPPLRTLEAHISAIGAFRVARPEHDQLRLLQAILDGAVVRRDAHPLAVTPVVHRAPVPALPAVRVRGHAREADQIAEAHQRAQVIADVTPLVMRRGGYGDGSGAV